MGLADAVRLKARAIREALSSRSALKAFLEVPGAGPGSAWTNEDLEPTPPARRTWTWLNYAVFYWGLSFGNWTLGSAMIGIGLSWWEAIVVIFVSQLVSSVAMLLNSRCASVYHVGFPVVSRSVFGMYGSFYPVGARAVLAVVWYGAQLYTGSSFVSVMLRAAFGRRYTGIPNRVPAGVGITTAGMLSFFLFWLVHLPLCAFRPYQLNRFFWLKGIAMCVAAFGLFAFAMANTGGAFAVGSVYVGSLTPAGKAWFVMSSINAGMGNTATLITNQPDLARWSRTRSGAMWPQLLTNPIAVTLGASLGILSTAAINDAWGLGTSIWNPWDLLGAILDRYWTAASRTAIFLCALCWMFSILGTNIAANMIPFGSDSTLLLPRYLTIPRGQFLVEFLAFAICPWKILASASVFTTFLSGYGIFLGAVVSVMIADYWLLTNGNVFTAWLYDPGKTNRHYRYHGGFNLQACIAYVVGVSLPFPGFVGTLGPKVSEAAAHLGELGWVLSFFASFAVYYGLCRVWPTENQRLVRGTGARWEEAAGAAAGAEADADAMTGMIEGDVVVADERANGVGGHGAAVAGFAGAPDEEKA